MSSRAAVSTRAGSSRRVQTQADKRPDLRLIKNSSPRRVAELSPRTRVVTLIGAVVAALFGVVVVHVNISQSQFAIEEMRAKANAEQDRYEKLRLEVAELESPATISAYATENLGLVVPEYVKPIAPTSADVAKGIPLEESNPPTEAGGDLGWVKLKPHLSASSS